MKRLSGPLLIGAVLALIYCAKIEPPPGGPIDKTGPTILGTVPVSEAVSVPLSKEIIITFSEGISTNSVQGGIFISPHISGDLKYKWNDRELTIRLPHNFSPNTTYIVNVGSSLSDLRNNRMDKSFQFAFSTGIQIDKGKVGGHVLQGGKPASGVSVAIYDTSQINLLTGSDSLIPPFMTQTGTDGAFLFDYLSPGVYFPLAFQDKNRNSSFDYPDEIFGIPDRLAIIDSSMPEPEINFNLTKDDTSTVIFQTITLTADRLVRVRFSRPVKSAKNKYRAIDAVLLNMSAGDSLFAGGAQPSTDDTSASFNFYFPLLNDGLYKLILKITNEDWPETLVLESVNLEFKLEPDITSPALKNLSCNDKFIFPQDSLIEMTFSEPLDFGKLSDSSVQVINTSDSSRLVVARLQENPFQLSMAVTELEWGETYLVQVKMMDIFDLSGNRAADSVISVGFRTFDDDSLGEVSGSLILLDSAEALSPVYLLFHSLNDNRDWRYPVRAGNFKFQFPPGKYLLSGFIDNNLNEQFDIGSLRPLHLAEVSGLYPDTVRVRARFETAGIEFRIR